MNAPSDPSISTEQLEANLANFRDQFGKLKQEIQKAIVGHEELLTDTLVAIFSRGHVLLEGVPGLGKTFLVKVLSKVLGLEPGRIQCTPDLMPADILGTQIVSDDQGHRYLRFEKGPVFANLVLVDEINRATPKTQAALLEVMQEHAVTSGGERHILPEPFFVMATQNPMEMEGTYPLPEAQLDRFMFKLKVPFPNLAELVDISKRTTGFKEIDVEAVMNGPAVIQLQESLTHIPVADPITEYAAALVLATHPDQPGSDDQVQRYAAYGSSPRGLQALIKGARVHAALDNRTAVAVEDIQRVALSSLRHRMILNFEGEAESKDVDQIVQDLLAKIPTPGKKAA